MKVSFPGRLPIVMADSLRASKAQADCAGLRSALDYVRDGPMLIVWKPARLGRSLFDRIGTVSTQEVRGGWFRALTEAIDTTTLGGEREVVSDGASA
jgi:DNA invertase Pin-like site-specific DNA recombinase